jgi:hypothetical protein
MAGNSEEAMDLRNWGRKNPHNTLMDVEEKEGERG